MVSALGALTSAAQSAASTGSGFGLDIAGMGIQYGLNAAAASKAHDRQKNWATRKYLYELIALKEAGINPAYMFSNEGNAAAARHQSSQMANKTDAPQLGAASLRGAQTRMVATQARNVESQTAANIALAEKHRADAELSRSQIGRTQAETIGAESLARLNDAQREHLALRVDYLKKHPETLAALIQKETRSDSIAGSVREALEGLFGQTGADVGVAGMAGLAVLAPLTAALATKNWHTTAKIGFAEAAKRGLKGKAAMAFTATLIRAVGASLPGLTAAGLVAALSAAERYGQQSGFEPGSGGGRNRANQ